MRDISYLIDFFGKMDGKLFNSIYEHVNNNYLINL